MGFDILTILGNMFSINNLLLVAGGTVMGITFGALPGFTAAMGIAVLLPITFGMNATSALMLLGGVYGGAMYGGSISAILINTPGTPAAAATTLDGYPMCKQGRAGEALRESVFASFLGGIFGVTVLLFFAPPLAKISLKFGPPEYLMLAIFGLTIIASLSEKSVLKGLIAGTLGLLISTIGMDPHLGMPRFTMGLSNLIDGIEMIPAMIGLFSIPETLNLISSYVKGDKDYHINTAEFRKIKVGFPSINHIRKHLLIYIKSSAIGTYVGALPGAGASIASFMAYNEAKRSSKHPEKFGTGITDGIAAAESANNAVAGGSLIPMLTLGVPGNSVSAILMGGLMIHGLEPGMALFQNHANITYTFIISMYLANVMMLLFGIYCAPYFTMVTNTPRHILAVSVITMTVIGSYALRGNIFDVYVMIAFGIIGYIMKSHGFILIPIVLGMILGPIAEKGLNTSIAIARGQNILLFILSRPISLILFVFTVISITIPIYRAFKDNAAKKATQE